MPAALKMPPAQQQRQQSQPRPPRLLTWDEYESAEQSSPIRHEFVNGRVFAMAGGSLNHNRTAGNLFAELRALLRGKPCEAFIADVKLRIELGMDEYGYYPDVMVVCDSGGKHRLHVTKPAVVFEVLSQSTERIDRKEKLLAYQAVPSLAAYVLIEQSAPQATICRRARNWQAETISGLEAVLPLPEIGAELSMAAIYERVDWSETDTDDNEAA